MWLLLEAVFCAKQGISALERLDPWIHVAVEERCDVLGISRPNVAFNASGKCHA